MAQGAGTRPWKRGNEAARAASTYVVPNGDLVVTDEGNIYAGDGTTQAKSLPRLSSVRELTTRIGTSVVGRGAKADYTGRIGTAGTGTDDRLAIQAAMDAASDIASSDYYAYLGRRSVTVKIPAGFYLIGAPASGPSLAVPPGVTLDASDASLFFDFPATATNDWCGIQVGQYANLIAGKIARSRRNEAPSASDMYDGVRLLFCDNNSRVVGYKDSEISGFQGAAIRGIGAWISHVKGIRFYGNRYGYIASNYGDAFSFPIPAGNPSGTTRRVHTDIYFEDCQFVNCAVAGFVGAAQGKASQPNALDFADSGTAVSFGNCIFENIGGYAISGGNILTLALHNVSLEEVGSGDGMVNFNTIRQVVISGSFRVNFAGRSVPGPTGNVTPNPSCIFKLSSVQAFSVQGFYVHNTFRELFAFAEGAAPVGHFVGPGFWDSYGFTAGVIRPTHKGATVSSALWNGGHWQFGSKHYWLDADGNLRSKATAPTSDTDGVVVGAGDGSASTPWRIEVAPWTPPSAQTNWTSITVDTGSIGNAAINSSGAQNDEIGWDVLVGAGTWNIDIIHTLAASRGIYNVYLDSDLVGTIDGYGSTALRNQRGSVVGVVVATTGKKRLRLRMATKNATSTGYLGSISHVAMQRTA